MTPLPMETPELSIRCRHGHHDTCTVGGCPCGCHVSVTGQLAQACAWIVGLHAPHQYINGHHQMYSCAECSQLAGIPIQWPCPTRQAVGALIPDASNRLLPPIPPGAAEGGGSPPG